MVWARLMIEEYEDGPWEDILTRLGFPVHPLHRGLYEVWNVPEEAPDEDAAFEHAAQFLRESGERLRALRTHLRNPMRLAFRYPRPLYVDQRWVACSTTIPAELLRLAGELGLSVELEPYYELRGSTTEKPAVAEGERDGSTPVPK